MNDRLQSAEPMPRWIHFGAVLAVACTFVLFAIGQTVTSFQAGMSDRVWPTEPWYLLENYKVDSRYLIEHTHRIAGFTVGIVVCLLSLTLWSTEPRWKAKWLAILGAVLLLSGFIEFQRALMAQRDVPTAEVQVPMRPVIVAAAGAVLFLSVGLAGVLSGVRGATLRLLGSTALISVMIQGLLGGLRVMLNALAGTDLAAFHGVFAQVVMSQLVFLAVATERRANASEDVDSRLPRWCAALTALVFVQIVWGALVRHNPNPLSQRLHFLTAFLALTAASLVLRAVFASPKATARAGMLFWLIAGLLAAQLYLGVEVWMWKFGTNVLPELVQVTQVDGVVRTLHALIGSGILMCSLALTLRLQRTLKSETPKQFVDESSWIEPNASRARSVPVPAGFQGNAP